MADSLAKILDLEKKYPKTVTTMAAMNISVPGPVLTSVVEVVEIFSIVLIALGGKLIVTEFP